VAAAVAGTRAAGCEWLHVDWEPGLAPFYVEACGFEPTEAGLIAVDGAPQARIERDEEERSGS
jgi:hypothetical protein